MRRYYIFVVALALLSLSLVIEPWVYQFFYVSDESAKTSLYGMQSSIDVYVTKHGALPSSLDEVDAYSASKNLFSRQKFTYQKLSDVDYKLCASAPYTQCVQKTSSAANNLLQKKEFKKADRCNQPASTKGHLGGVRLEKIDKVLGMIVTLDSHYGEEVSTPWCDVPFAFDELGRSQSFDALKPGDIVSFDLNGIYVVGVRLSADKYTAPKVVQKPNEDQDKIRVVVETYCRLLSPNSLTGIRSGIFIRNDIAYASVRCKVSDDTNQFVVLKEVSSSWSVVYLGVLPVPDSISQKYSLPTPLK